MTIRKIYPENIENFSIITHPHKHYSSSSSGIVGDEYVYARRSNIEKEYSEKSSFIEVKHNDNSILENLNSIKNVNKNITNNLYQCLNSYMNRVSSLSIESRKQKTHEIKRITPDYVYSNITSKKLIIKDILNSYYRAKYPTAHWSYTNYNCLNFFTASSVPEESVLLYPNIDNVVGGDPSGQYILSGAFTFEFYINPRYKNESSNKHFKAGTICHLSSCYSISLISGSKKDANGLVDSFRILLQLSHSADISPSLVNLTSTSYPNNLVFVSDDNSIDYNTWNHVVIRWGTSNINDGSGSILIDSGKGYQNKGYFCIPSSSLSPKEFSLSCNPDVLCIGNYYEGSNTGANAQSLFFSHDVSKRDGLVELVNTTDVDQPTSFYFRHPLNAEIHDISISPYYKTNYELTQTNNKGPTDLSSYCFYLSPLFLRESPLRKYYGSYGGILQTPFESIDGTTTDPFNIALSFGVGGHDINLENFVKDLANDLDPRCFALTASIINVSTDVRTANDFLWDQKSCIKRNLLLLPCDDGRFIPNYNLITNRPINPLNVTTNESLISDDGLSYGNYVDSLGIQELSYISLDNLLSEESNLFDITSMVRVNSSGLDEYTSTFSGELIGVSPESFKDGLGTAFRSAVSKINSSLANGTYTRSSHKEIPYTIYQRTKDSSSNEIVIFDISNLFYGDKIQPKSLIITDSDLSGSDGKINITLKDDGYGNIYRSNSLVSTSATWNNIGNVYYDEGLILIKSPHIFQFGKNQFEFQFNGERSIHVNTIDVLAPSNLINSSSNPSYLPVSASLYANDNDKKFVYISSLNFHDEDMNVIMKTKLAQPITKREGSSIAFKVKMDY